MTTRARVREAAALSPTLRRFVLEPADGGLFPVAAAGAHALLALEFGGRVHRRAYSLAELPSHRRHVAIIVRRVAASRGGSAFLHEAVRPGHVLAMDTPRNLFPIPRLARRHVLLAAGIGITPFLAWLPELARAGTPARLEMFCRAGEDAVIAGLLPGHTACVTFHTARGALPDLLADLPIGTHVSVCGPQPFIDDATTAALAAGFPPAKIHRESFGAAAPGNPFVAVLARGGRRIEIGPDTSLLEALEEAGLDPPSLCRGGVCGQCRLPVLAGTPEHRDHVLTSTERAAGQAIMTCVSRAATNELVLDF